MTIVSQSVSPFPLSGIQPVASTSSYLEDYVIESFDLLCALSKSGDTVVDENGFIDSLKKFKGSDLRNLGSMISSLPDEDERLHCIGTLEKFLQFTTGILPSSSPSTKSWIYRPKLVQYLLEILYPLKKRNLLPNSTLLNRQLRCISTNEQYPFLKQFADLLLLGNDDCLDVDPLLEKGPRFIHVPSSGTATHSEFWKRGIPEDCTFRNELAGDSTFAVVQDVFFGREGVATLRSVKDRITPNSNPMILNYLNALLRKAESPGCNEGVTALACEMVRDFSHVGVTSIGLLERLGDLELSFSPVAKTSLEIIRNEIKIRKAESLRNSTDSNEVKASIKELNEILSSDEDVVAHSYCKDEAFFALLDFLENTNPGVRFQAIRATIDFLEKNGLNNFNTSRGLLKKRSTTFYSDGKSWKGSSDLLRVTSSIANIFSPKVRAALYRDVFIDDRLKKHFSDSGTNRAIVRTILSMKADECEVLTEMVKCLETMSPMIEDLEGLCSVRIYREIEPLADKVIKKINDSLSADEMVTIKLSADDKEALLKMSVSLVEEYLEAGNIIESISSDHERVVSFKEKTDILREEVISLVVFLFELSKSAFDTVDMSKRDLAFITQSAKLKIAATEVDRSNYEITAEMVNQDPSTWNIASHDIKRAVTNLCKHRVPPAFSIGL